MCVYTVNKWREKDQRNSFCAPFLCATITIAAESGLRQSVPASGKLHFVKS